MPSNDYAVVLYHMASPQAKTLVASRSNMGEARRVCQEFAGRGWQMQRRPDVHTFGDLVLTIQKGKP